MLTFPPNPVVGTEHQEHGNSWIWNDRSVWERGAGPLPVITALVPNVGPFNINTAVTIQGENFMQASRVQHDGVLALGGYVSPTEMRTTMPPGAVGAVVQVRVKDGQQLSNSLPFTYEAAPPMLIELNPSSVEINQNPLLVNVIGQFFTPASVVYGNTTALVTTFVDENTLTVIAPTGGAEATIQISVHDGALVTTSLPFIYHLPPGPILLSTNLSTVWTIWPPGTVMTFFGANFSAACKLAFQAPAQARTRQTVNLSAVITENRGDLGAICTAYLMNGTTIIDRAEGVKVVAGGAATVLFSTHFSEPAIPVSHSWTIATRSWLGASSSASVGDGAPATAPST